jgi:flagellar biosynthesis GTPase FlhF
MSTKSNCKCCDHTDHLKVESLTLDDGRKAERHVTVDVNGNELVEIFAEEKRPLKLEKRIIRESKNIISKEIHQTVKDGEIAYEEVHAMESEAPLQVRERIGVVQHAKIVDGDYVRKDEIQNLIAEGVVAGVSALMENMEPLSKQSNKSIFKAQEVVEKNVEEKKKNDVVVNAILGCVIVAQLVFFVGYMFLM